MRAIVLLSGGLDSTVCLAFALREIEVALCLTADYGQMAAAREIAAARALAAHYGLQHAVVDLPFLSRLSEGSLFGKSPLPEPEDSDLDDPETRESTARSVWVPNRNGVLVNVAASYAEALGCERIIAGFNREEAAGFPDNSPGFVDAVNTCFRYSTGNRVRLVSYTLHLDKTEIVQLGRRLEVPWNLIWSCYRGGSQPCGVCESCRRLRRAMDNA